MIRRNIYYFWWISVFLLLSWTLFAFPPFSPIRDRLGLFTPIFEYLAIGVMCIYAVLYAITSLFAHFVRSTLMLFSSLLISGLSIRSSDYIKHGNIDVFALVRAVVDDVSNDPNCNEVLSTKDICAIYVKDYGDGEYLLVRLRSSNIPESDFNYKWPPFPEESVEIKRILERYAIIWHPEVEDSFSTEY